jgi:hypothetical protein
MAYASLRSDQDGAAGSLEWKAFDRQVSDPSQSNQPSGHANDNRGHPQKSD